MNWKQIFTNNLGWKLASLFVAMMIWANYHAEEIGWRFGTNLFKNEGTKHFIGFQIQLLSKVSSQARAEVTPSSVSITIRGEREIIEPVSKEEVLVFVDISELPPGSSNSVPVKVRIPEGLRIDEVWPSNVVVRVPALQPST